MRVTQAMYFMAPQQITMNLRGEKLARSLLVNESFDQVGKIPFVQRKWITAEA